MLGKNFICGESLSVWWRGRNENKLGLEVTFGVKIAEERNDTIGVRQSRWTRLVTGLLKAWPPNPVCQFGAERINYHTNALPFNQIVIPTQSGFESDDQAPLHSFPWRDKISMIWPFKNTAHLIGTNATFAEVIFSIPVDHCTDWKRIGPKSVQRV